MIVCAENRIIHWNEDRHKERACATGTALPNSDRWLLHRMNSLQKALSPSGAISD